MKPRTAVLMGAIGLAGVVIVAPMTWSTPSSNAYFEDARCACGHDSFIRLKGGFYLSYSPGHGVPEHQQYSLRRKDDGWQVLALASPPEFWSPLKEGQVVATVRLQSGDLYECASGTTNLVRHARVYSPFRLWRLWVAKFLNE